MARSPLQQISRDLQMLTEHVKKISDELALLSKVVHQYGVVDELQIFAEKSQEPALWEQDRKSAEQTD